MWIPRPHRSCPGLSAPCAVQDHSSVVHSTKGWQISQTAPEQDRGHFREPYLQHQRSQSPPEHHFCPQFPTKWCTNTHTHSICSSTIFIGNFVLREAPRGSNSNSLREWTLPNMEGVHCLGGNVNLDFQAPCHGLFTVVLYKWALQTEHSSLGGGGSRNYEFCVYELYFCKMYLLHLFTLYLWAIDHTWTVYSEFRIWILQT